MLDGLLPSIDCSVCAFALDACLTTTSDGSSSRENLRAPVTCVFGACEISTQEGHTGGGGASKRLQMTAERTAEPARRVSGCCERARCGGVPFRHDG